MGKPAAVDLDALGGAFWSDSRTAAVLDDLAGDGEADVIAFKRVLALLAAEAGIRRVAEVEVARLRAEHGVTWQAIADAIGLSQPATMQRYSKKHREANAARQRKDRAKQDR